MQTKKVDQELEDAAKKYAYKGIPPLEQARMDAFKAGAEWQKKRMWSNEQVIKFGQYITSAPEELVKIWIEDFNASINI